MKNMKTCFLVKEKAVVKANVRVNGRQAKVKVEQPTQEEEMDK